ncbi:MAG TPA: alpha/beta hydrolase [Gammaproteobacteria bacterium]|nr:alpha/beta hydrolase [Gammaproteobacteria bacterium]HJP42144.1 alpha/beta hydrolase [Gammaproteobacteria bacterium]
MSRLIKKIFTFLCALFGLCYIGLIIYAYMPNQEYPIESFATKDDQFADINGQKIRYREFNEGTNDKPYLILIHGFGHSLDSWRRVRPELQKYYHVVALDLIGFGLSSKPVDYDHSNENQAATIGLFADYLGIEKFIIGGHSLGGAIAVHIALNNKKTTGAILFNPGIINTGVPKIFKYINPIFPFSRVTAKQFSNREFRTKFLKRSFVNPSIVTDEVMDEVMLAVQTEDYMDGTASLMKKFNDPHEFELLPFIEVPTLIVFGMQDRNKSLDEAKALNDNIRGSKLVLVQQAGHYVHEEQPEIVAKIIIENLSFLSARIMGK